LLFFFEEASFRKDHFQYARPLKVSLFSYLRGK
jgi:hypothetical protein